MKDVYMQVMQENQGIPPEMTLADIVRMKELQIYNWQEYEREQEKRRVQQYQSENSGEIAKIEQTTKKFSARAGHSKEKESEQ
jgi:hypothetical protein